MKALVIFFFLFAAYPGKTQYLLDEKKIWMEVHETINFGVFYEYFQLQGDTVIDIKAYKKLYRKTSGSPGDWEYIYGMREDSSKKVYFVLREDEEERLLYDFNLQPGDSFIICNNADIVVTTIDTVILENGDSRRRIQFDPGPETWIEGVGSLDGIVADGGWYYCNTTGEDFPFLNCLTYDGDAVYIREWSLYPCLDGTTSSYTPKRNSIQLYPNPFNNSTTLVLPDNESSGELFIYNFQGELVDHRLILDQFTTINRVALPNGIYIYQFLSSEGQVLIEKVVME